MARLPEQELRLAVVMTGGVSLAIWMGGVASEIDQLIRTRGIAEADRTPEQKVYGELLELSNFVPRVDVVSGTSAGGVNGALLAGAVARRKTLEGLRDIWLKVADFSELLRSPFEKDQQSLLKGDQYFTPGLQQGIESVLGSKPVQQGADHPVELLVTTTLLNGEDSGIADSYGTQIPDVHHNALFRFDREKLMSDPKLVSRLALAARSSASFPVAFEPSWVPCDPKAEDDDHPSMRGIADFHANHFVIDGGVLVNRPIEPALRAIFAMPADDEDVSRVLLYVVPDPGETLVTDPEEQDAPFTLTDVGLKSLVGIPRTQSIARDLERIKEHDARVEEQRSAREFILEHCYEGLADRVGDLLGDYRSRRADREAEWILGELTLRWRDTMEKDLSFDPIKRGDLVRDLAVEREGSLPQEMPEPDASAADIAAWGIDSLERAATVTLDLAGRAWRRARPGQVRTDLENARDQTHTALTRLRELRRARRAALAATEQTDSVEALTAAMLEVLRGDDKELDEAARDIAGALRDAAAAIGQLPDGALVATAKMMAGKLVPTLGMTDGECLGRLFALEVIQDALGITNPVIEQRVKLLQVSANTRDGISQMKSARDKLTGMRLIHFGAFYKTSWRANDWMWGRLDAAGWLTQLLLDPARLDLLYPNATPDERVEKILEEIKRIAIGPGGPDRKWLEDEFKEDEADIRAELAWLKDPDPKVPPSLPLSTVAVARRIQLAMLVTELPGIAEAVELDEARDALSPSGRDFRAIWKEIGPNPNAEGRKKGLVACDFAAEGFREEYDSGLLARSTTGAAATATSALAGTHSGLPDLIAKSKIMTSVRGLGLALHGVVDAALRRSRMAFAIIVALSAVAGGALGAAAAIEGPQPVLAGFGFAVAFAVWAVALWRYPKAVPARERDLATQALLPPKESGLKWLGRYVGYLLLTFVVLVFCAAVSLIPWSVGKWIEDCPKQDKDCFRGDVESFITGLEPAFIVLAVVLGAMVFGWKAASPKEAAPPAPNPRRVPQTAD